MKRFLPTLLLIAFCAPLCCAQSVLTLNDCRQMALRSNHELEIGRLGINKATYERRAAETNKLPKVSATAAYMRLGRKISLLSNDQKNVLASAGTNLVSSLQQTLSPTVEQLQPLLAQHPEFSALLEQYGPDANAIAEAINGVGRRVVRAFDTDSRNIATAGLLVTQPLYMGGKVMAYERLTKHMEQLEGEKLRGTEQALLLDVDQAYWQVVSLVSKKRLAEDYLDMLRHLDRDVKLMLENGVATRAQLLTVDVKVNEAEMTLTKVDNGLSLSRMLLCQLIGLPLDSKPVLADEKLDNIAVQTHDVSVDPVVALMNRPETEQLRLASQIYDEKVKIERAEFRPQVALIGGAAFTTPSLYNGFQRSFQPNWAVGITLKVPVWNWKEGHYKVSAARADAQMQRLRLAEVSEKIELQVNQQSFRLNEARKRLSLSLKNLEKAEENLRMANLGHREGVITTSDALAAHTAWMQAESDKIDAQIEVMLARTSLFKALGTLQVDTK